jgi:Rad3-related DNA helicase
MIRINIPNKDLGFTKEIFQKNKEFFRFNKPRIYQDQIIGLILDAIKNGYKNIVLQAPTGIGKSDIAMAIANKYKDDQYFLLSMNLGLCTQYKDDFSQLIEVKGRNNFPCIARRGKTAEAGPCTYRKKFKCDKIDKCPYELQKRRAKLSDTVLSTPHYICRANFQQRCISIWDEAHNLESFFMSMAESYITEDEYMQVFSEPLPSYPSPDYWREKMKQIEIYCQKRIDREDFLTDREVNVLGNLIRRCGMAINLLSRDEKRFIISFEKTPRKKNIVKFLPVKVDTIARGIIDDVSDVRIFMSATIPSINQFVFNLGLNEKETFYINVTESPFPVGNRPINYEGVAYLTYKHRDEGIIKISQRLCMLMMHYKDKRGVILPITHNFRKKIYDYLKDKNFGDRILTHETDKNHREDIIDRFITEISSPLVLISTYVNEGFSFNDKLAEWLVFIKLPFPNITDKVIEARLFLEQEYWREKKGCDYQEPKRGRLCTNFGCQKCRLWYNSQTAAKLVQGLGRIVRSDTDKGEMWILDKSFPSFYDRWNFLLPEWFKESIQWK